jgi:DNA-binding HxlR family transcriptional regulator
MDLPNKLEDQAGLREELSSFCPAFHQAVELIGRRWTGAILRAMMSGVTRFSELSATVPGLSDKMLSERLKELESQGIILRRVIPVTPVRIEYELTDKGRDLEQVVQALADWTGRWTGDGTPEEAAAAGARRG